MPSNRFAVVASWMLTMLGLLGFAVFTAATASPYAATTGRVTTYALSAFACLLVAYLFATVADTIESASDLDSTN